MSLNFPREPEVQLKNPPLIEVVCQVRFPPILRIAKEEPSEFQEYVRSQFPQLELEQGLLIRIPGVGSSGAPAAETQARVYRFQKPDGQIAISLAVDFYALVTNQYTRWEDFARDLSLAHEAAQRVYSPAYSTRIGLRYVNRLAPSNTGCKTVSEMLDLLRPELTAQLRSTAWSDPASMLCQLVLTDSEAKLTLRTGYGQEQDEPFFLLDFDYYEEGRLGLENLVERCNHYHEAIYDAFRWCLRDESLAVFEPIAEETAHP